MLSDKNIADTISLIIEANKKNLPNYYLVAFLNENNVSVIFEKMALVGLGFIANKARLSPFIFNAHMFFIASCHFSTIGTLCLVI